MQNTWAIKSTPRKQGSRDIPVHKERRTLVRSAKWKGLLFISTTIQKRCSGKMIWVKEGMSSNSGSEIRNLYILTRCPSHLHLKGHVNLTIKVLNCPGPIIIVYRCQRALKPHRRLHLSQASIEVSPGLQAVMTPSNPTLWPANLTFISRLGCSLSFNF